MTSHATLSHQELEHLFMSVDPNGYADWAYHGYKWDLRRFISWKVNEKYKEWRNVWLTDKDGVPISSPGNRDMVQKFDTWKGAVMFHSSWQSFEEWKSKSFNAPMTELEKDELFKDSNPEGYYAYKAYQEWKKRQSFEESERIKKWKKKKCDNDEAKKEIELLDLKQEGKTQDLRKFFPNKNVFGNGINVFGDYVVNHTLEECRDNTKSKPKDMSDLKEGQSKNLPAAKRIRVSASSKHPGFNYQEFSKAAKETHCFDYNSYSGEDAAEDSDATKELMSDEDSAKNDMAGETEFEG